ncbi:hypothetical protein U91I_02740 [alpha proteobacterium U9-1i]|nr:hypothetical protein U91I_02740 [alpha proteobacterium U9-1i]
MTELDLFIRHGSADEARAGLLSRALAPFGYIARSGPALPPAYQGSILYLWSPSAICDDDLIWEAASTVKPNYAREVDDRVYEAIISPVRARVKLRSRAGGKLPENRLGNFVPDLSTWAGQPDDPKLLALIWELPPPVRPAEQPPLEKPRSRDEAIWRSARETRDVLSLFSLIQWRLPSPNKHRSDQYLRAELDDIKTLAADPDCWSRLGERAYAAAKAGPAALHAWASMIKETGHLEDATGHLSAGEVWPLLLLVQIVVGPDFPPLTDRDFRSIEELLRLAERGDVGAIASFRYADADVAAKADPILEQLADAGVAAAQHAIAERWATKPLRKRSLLEKAVAQDYAPACFSLGDLFDRTQWQRGRAVGYWRRGAALGDDWCKEKLAIALDREPRRDAKAAFALYWDLESRAIENGWKNGQRSAQMLWDGDGVPRDRDSAIKLFFKHHIENGSPTADIHIGDLYRDGLGELAQDIDEAIAWYRVSFAAENSDVHDVARLRLRELGVELSEHEKDGEEVDEEDDPKEREQRLAAAKKFWRPRD